MKKKISICLFVFCTIFLSVVLMFVVKFYSKDVKDIPTPLAAKEEETELDEFTEIMAINDPFLYLVKDVDGFLVVYQSDGITVEFETNIRTKDLAEDVLERIREGLGFYNDESLYSFLESYSS